jgi:hypothetical protein
VTVLNEIFSGSIISFLIHFFFNLISIILVAYFIYFKRHSRRDLLMAFTALNVGLFLVMTVMSTQQTAMGVGFGLFAILSIVRIRSEAFSNTELAYVFVVLVIALINAFGVSDATPAASELTFALLLNVIAVSLVFIIDHPRLMQTVGRKQITLDRIHPTDQSLRADLEQRLNVRVLDYAIDHVDYVREITVLNVRYADNPAS